MTAILISLMFAFIFTLIAVLINKEEKRKQKQFYKLADKKDQPVYLTKKEIKALSEKNFLTSSWYKKRPGKNKGL